MFWNPFCTQTSNIRVSTFTSDSEFVQPLHLITVGQCFIEVAQYDKFGKMLFVIQCQFSKEMPKQLDLWVARFHPQKIFGEKQTFLVACFHSHSSKNVTWQPHSWLPVGSYTTNLHLKGQR